MTISDWLKQATKELKQIGIASSRLDAEIILSHTLLKPRTYLHAHLDETIDPRREDIADARLELRKERTPIAYITGHKEFYGRQFYVSPAVLVPRPETEDLITMLLETTASEITPKRLVDVGTGSGVIGITAKLERPHLMVELRDISAPALKIARKNAETLGAEVTIRQTNLLDGFIGSAHYITANLPYVSRSWDGLSPELDHEPEIALYADESGVALIIACLQQAVHHLVPNGVIFLEADPEQFTVISKYAAQVGLTPFQSQGYCIAFTKGRTD